MSVRERMEVLEEEMDALFHRKVEIRTLRKWLADNGHIPPENPNDVSAELRTLLDHLASLGIVVEFGDHLDNRELYAWLGDQLNGHMALTEGTILHFDVIGGGSDEDNQIYLTYYATDQERASWKEEFPDEELPPRKKPLYDRNRHGE